MKKFIKMMALTAAAIGMSAGAAVAEPLKVGFLYLTTPGDLAGHTPMNLPVRKFRRISVTRSRRLSLKMSRKALTPNVWSANWPVRATR